MVALDASALIAYLFHEPGREVVAEEIADSCMSAVNYAEVVTCFARESVDLQLVEHAMAASPVEIATFDTAQAHLTGTLVAQTKHLGLSLGDRACLALALGRGIPAMTADQAWAALDVGVDVRVIR